MTNLNLDKYAQLKLKIAELEVEAAEIRPSIIEEMQSRKVDEIEHPDGSFLISLRRTWKYPAHVITAEAILKKGKKTAEQTGEATYTEKPMLTFRSIKS